MDPRSKNKYFKKKLGLYSFMDETGNTGLNLVDKDQPFFILGNAYSNRNIDVDGKIYFNEIHRKIKSPELHANVTGNKGLSSINDELISLMNDLDIQFHFSVIEKEHYLKLILFHHFFDNGPNPAVSWAALGVRVFRLMLSLNFVQLVEDLHLQKYLIALKTLDLKLYSDIHADLAEKVKRSPFDKRTIELLYDALIYTAKNPKDIFESMSYDKICSPNNQAFVLMINQMHEHYKDNAVFREVTHDEQKEFGNNIQQSFNVLSPLYHPSKPLTMIGEYEESPLMKNAKFTIRPSHESLGLQTIDPAIWLFKRNIITDKNDQTYLFEQIMNRTSFSGITFMMHAHEMQGQQSEIMNRPITEEQIAKGKELMDLIEKKRWKSDV